jgi:diguanylate cyclase (GGDEF)-like protein
VIDHVLKTIGKFAGVDRSYLLLINENNPSTVDNTHEWCSPGTQSVMAEIQNFNLEKIDWWHVSMNSGRSMFIDNLDQLPKDAAAEKEIFSSQSIKSIANIPLFIDGKLAGALGFDAVKENVYWGKEIIVLLEVVGSIIANAIDRQRHENRLTESRLLHQLRSEELAALRDTITDITSELEINKLLQTILERSIKLLKADGGDICVFDEDKNALRVVAIVKMDKRHLHTYIQLGKGAAGNAALNRKPVILDDYSVWDKKIDEYDYAHIRSAMVSPLIIGDRLLGTVGIFHYAEDKRFYATDLHLISLFAQHASIALNNAILFEKIHELARIDELTGLLNRRSFMERAEYELNRAKRLNKPLTLAMIDLDNFKQVNDRFSHQVGDKVLMEISDLFSTNFRNIDIVSRYGGDEFTVLMPETSVETAKVVLQRINSMLAEYQFESGKDPFNITASIGLATFSHEKNSLEEMISSADKAMYRAKNIGKSQISQ